MIAGTSGIPSWTASTANTAPASPLTEPIDRSISPSSRTKMMPTAISPGPAMSMEMFDRFCADRKASSRPWKIAMMRIRPTMTGTEPSSPPRMRRLNSVR